MWSPDYDAVYTKRLKTIELAKTNPQFKVAMWAHYKNDAAAFINDFIDTYDPRRLSDNLNPNVPFCLYPRQEESVQFFDELLAGKASGAVAKARATGLSYTALAWSVHKFIFMDNSAIAFGSRKLDFVDRKDDMSALLPKARKMLDRLPKMFLPEGYDTAYCRIYNPATQATITGEGGSGIGRGGRTTAYVVDESAFIDNQESMEASLSANTNTVIHISTPNGTGNNFHKKVVSGANWSPKTGVVKTSTNIFDFTWRDNPNYSEKMMREKRERAESEGLLGMFLQEYECSFESSGGSNVINFTSLEYAKDLYKLIKFGGKITNSSDVKYTAYDPAGESGNGDKHAIASRTGIVLDSVEEFDTKDLGSGLNRAVAVAKRGVIVYDAIGVGEGLKAISKRINLRETEVSAWKSSFKPYRPRKRITSGEALTAEQYYSNRKAQGYWELRMRFERTREYIQNPKERHTFDMDTLIAIPPKMALAVLSELSQPTYTIMDSGKIKIDKAPDGTKSPNMADAIMMAYHPCKTKLLRDI